MKRLESRIIWGSLLILGGVLFLLSNLGIFNFLGGLSGLLIAGLFAAGGLAFLGVLLSNRDHWWAAIPGFTLLGLAGTVFFSDVVNLDQLGGAIFLGSIGLGFLVVYLVRSENWWAIIPAGTLATLATVTVVDTLPGGDGGGIFFLGLGLTFAVLGLLPTSQGHLRWAFIPATVLIVFGLVVGTPVAPFLSYVWPVALILAGLYLISRRYLAM